jgi:hypothetical protein
MHISVSPVMRAQHYVAVDQAEEKNVEIPIEHGCRRVEVVVHDNRCVMSTVPRERIKN